MKRLIGLVLKLIDFYLFLILFWGDSMKFKGLLAGLAMLITAGSADAASIKFELNILGSTNVPQFQLMNLSDVNATIEQFTFTIGNTSKNFDYVGSFGGTVPLGSVSTEGTDTVNGGARTDLIDLVFSNGDFGKNQILTFETDVDRDNSNTIENYKTVFGNNGGLLNSIATVIFKFENKLFKLTDTFPDLSQNSYTLSGDVNIAQTPLPAGVWLFGSALAGLGLMKRRKNKTSAV